jgi:Co/Zn/Cd efflux system component
MFPFFLHSPCIEVVGAIISVLIIWVITGVLFYEAVKRVIHPTEINANIMLITACIAVYVNVL